jgi:hypothetical protein
MSGIPESMTNWAIARQGGGISVESSADFLRESCDVENLVENLIEKPAAEGGAGEVDPLEDVNADLEKLIQEDVDADSEAPDNLNTTDQNDNVEKHVVPLPNLDDLDRLFRNREWNIEGEDLDE